MGNISSWQCGVRTANMDTTSTRKAQASGRQEVPFYMMKQKNKIHYPALESGKTKLPLC